MGSGNPKCANCMVSCGYEPTAVMDGFGSMRGLWAMIRGTFSRYNDPHALKLLNEFPKRESHSTLVQIETTEREMATR